MSELQEYKKLVSDRLDSIGETLAKVALGDNSQRINLFEIGDNEFGQFAFGLDTLIEDLIEARKAVEQQQAIEKKRADIWRRIASSYSSSTQMISEVLRIISEIFHIDTAAYFIARPNDEEYQMIDINTDFPIEDTHDYHFSKNYITIDQQHTSTILHLDKTSRLYDEKPPEPVLSIAKIVKAHQFASMWALFVYDQSTDSRIALLLGKYEKDTWDPTDEQIFKTMALISFARYYQLRSQEELQKINQNLAQEVESRTKELSTLNRRLQRDLLEQEKAEKQIRNNMETYRTLIEAIPDPILTITSTGQIKSANTSAVHFFGLNTQEELVGYYLRDFCDSDYSTQFSTLTTPNQEMEFHSIDGQKHWCEFNLTVLNIYSSYPKDLRICILHDITERRIHEQEMARIQSLESLGILAGGIAHDFNNILSGVAGNLYLASKLQEKNAKKSQKLLDTAHQSIVRAKSLTSQLLTFAKGGAPVKQVLDFKDLLSEAVSFALAGSEVACKVNLVDELLMIEGDRSQLIQVFTNLLLNGAQETTDATLYLEAQSVFLDNNNKHGLSKGNYLHICVADRGRGISAEVAPYVFHPFFTTKAKGTGLGLTIVFSIVNNHNGTVFFEPREGGGTVFHVYLPATNRPLTRKITSEEVTTAGINNDTIKNLAVLCMDDDDTIREMALELFTFMGCQPTMVKNGEEALTAYKQALEQGTPFDAVILDLTIVGGMGGKETMAKLKEIDPNAYGIVVSGYSNDPVMAHYQDYGFSAILAKPYTIDELNHVLKHIKK